MTEEQEKQHFISKKLLLTPEESPVGFTCKICSGFQQIEAEYLGSMISFPVCNKCRAAIKTLVSKQDNRLI